MEDFKMYSKIQQAKNQGFSKNATANNLKLNWRTVDAYWDMTPEEYALKRQSMYNRGIDEYKCCSSVALRVHDITHANKDCCRNTT